MTIKGIGDKYKFVTEAGEAVSVPMTLADMAHHVFVSPFLSKTDKLEKLAELIEQLSSSVR